LTGVENLSGLGQIIDLPYAVQTLPQSVFTALESKSSDLDMALESKSSDLDMALESKSSDLDTALGNKFGFKASL
jgi:hypothetical protein